MQSSVYFVQDPGSRDLSSASRYGAIRFLLDAGDKPSMNPTAALNKIRSGLKNFNGEMDYIVFAGGDPMAGIIAGVAVGELAGLGLEQVSILRWERERDLNGQKKSAIIDGKTQHVGFYVPARLVLKP